MSSQIQITGETKVKSLTGVLVGTSGVVSSLNIDGSLGIPQLDVNGKILVSQLPNSVMEYKGVWNAATNTPTLANGTGNQGDVYLCNVAGTVNFGAGAIAFFVGDQVIYSGSIWQRASGATGTVTSVAVTETGDSLNITGSPITTSGTINIGFNGTNLQYVNGAGNLTTFPILTGYVPYTGATQDVDLGAFSLNGKSLHIKGTAGNGHLGLKHQSAAATGSANESLIYADSLGDLSWQNANLYLSKFITSANTANRSYTFPNATCNIPDDSLVVHLAGTETITGAKTFSGYTTFTSTVDITSGLTFSNSGFTLVLQPPTLSVNRTVTLPNGTGTLALTSDLTGYLTAVTATSPLSSSGGTTPNITIAQATTSANGYLSSTDWNTFNNKQATITLTTTGTSGAATLIGATLNIPNYAPDLSGYVTLAGSQTITGAKTFSTFTKFDGGVILKNNVSASLAGYVGLSAYSASGNKGINIDFDTYSASFYFSGTLPYQYTFPAASGTIALVGGSGVGTVTSVAALTIGTSGTDLSSTVATSTTTPVITLNVPTASATNRGALSSADWTTFNNKQSALTNPVTGTGNNNYLAKFTGASTIGNSTIFDNGGNIGINNTNSYNKLDIVQVGSNNAVSGVGLKIVSDAGNAASMALSQSGRGTATIGMQASGAAPCNFVIGTDVTGAFLFKKGLGGTYGTDLSTGTTQMTLDASGNLGLNFTPSATGTNARALQLTNYGTVSGNGNIGSISLAANAYESADNSWNRVNATSAGLYQISYSGQHSWSYTGASTANSGITWTQAMTLESGGSLLLRTTSNPYSLGSLVVNHNSTYTRTYFQRGVDLIEIAPSDGTAANQISSSYTSAGSAYKPLSLSARQNSADLYLATSGNVLIGTTTDAGYKLDVNGTGRFSGNLTLAASTVGLVLNDTSGAAAGSVIFHNNGTQKWNLTTLATSNNFALYNNGGTNSYNLQIVHSTGAATFSSSVTAASITTNGNAYIQPNASSNNVGLFIQNNSTGGYGSSLALGLYGYTTSAYFNPLRIEASYPGYGLVNFYVKSQSNSSEISALQLGGTGAATFSNSFTTSDTSALFLSPSLGTNQTVFLQLGKNIADTYNSGEMSFKFVASGSSSNMVSLGFYGAGQKLNVLGNGNVGIGTNSPLNKLDIVQVGSNNAVAGVGLKIVSDAGNPASIALSQSGRGTVTIGMAAAGAAPADFVLGTDVTGNIIFKQGLAGTYGTDLTTGTERMRITSGGILQVANGSGTLGTIVGSERLNVNGDVYAYGKYTGTSFFESSDMRIKTLIQDNYQTKGIASITPKLYTKNGKVELGYYAQDFVGVLDSAISKGSDDMLSLSYREVHTAKIYALEQRIKELESKLN